VTAPPASSRWERAGLVFAYAALAGVGGFYALGVAIALVLGGTQAPAPSTR